MIIFNQTFNQDTDALENKYKTCFLPCSTNRNASIEKNVSSSPDVLPASSPHAKHESRNQGFSGRWQGNRTRQSPQHTAHTSGSLVRPSVPDNSSQVPQPPQQPRTTSTTEDEQVVSILMQMYPMLRPDQVRERVFMSHNRREPFDQPLLLERCLGDIRNLFLMNPGDEFESQTPSSSSVAISYTTASFVVPWVLHLSPPSAHINCDQIYYNSIQCSDGESAC